MSRPVEIARYSLRPYAEMAAGVLADEGIDSVVVADDAGGMYAGIAPARLMVDEADAERARGVLADLDVAPGDGEEPSGG
ncbi:MAG: DUF2007 domain-containing protein [Gemmatimonadota bacterium]|nr:DUF2007 domain-containing protein [Gemmatimonadota bacterium]